MDYINHSMRGMDMLYKADDCECPPWYIWNTSKEDFVDEWEAQYSMKFGDTMAAMSQQQGKMLGTITEYAAKVRDAFAAYSVAAAGTVLGGSFPCGPLNQGAALCRGVFRLLMRRHCGGWWYPNSK